MYNLVNEKNIGTMIYEIRGQLRIIMINFQKDIRGY